MKKAEFERQQTTLIIGIVSILYATIKQLTVDLAVLPADADIQLNLALFVPAIAAIVFGKTVGGTSAAGGSFLSLAGTSLYTQNSAALVELGNLILIISDFIGSWTVGALTERPEIGKLVSLRKRFYDSNMWGRIGSNTVGSLVGVGLAESFISAYSTNIFQGDSLVKATSSFVKQFYTSSVILLVFVPFTLILYEFGIAFIDMRSLRIDTKLRKLFYMTPEESVATITKVILPKKAFTKNEWATLRIKFRNTLQKATKFTIEAISTARIHPYIDATKMLEPGELWEQNFFVLPAKQPSVDTRIRISPSREISTETNQTEKQTLLEISGRTYDSSPNALLMTIFSLINLISAGLTILWTNFISLLNLDLTEALNMLQSSFSLLVITGAIETIVYVPLILFVRRRILKLKLTELRLSFGAEITDYVENKTRNKIFSLLKAFKHSLQLFISVTLIAATVISAIVLGVEGARLLMDPTYKGLELYAQDVMILGLIVFTAWVFGIKGSKIIREAGLVKKKGYTLDKSENVLQEFSPFRNFQRAQPNNCSFTVHNPADRKGLRLSFVGFDTVSPPFIELINLPSKGTTEVSTVITPLDEGKRELLILSYPVYDENGKYIDKNVAEPFASQNLTYSVQPESKLGLTKEQRDNLQRLGLAVIGLLVVILTSSQIYQSLSSLMSDITITEFIRNNAPFLLGLQVPFVYIYFYLQNKWMTERQSFMNLLEQASTTDGVITELNKSVNDQIGSIIERNVKDMANKQISSLMDDKVEKEVLKHINTIIQDNIAIITEKKVKDKFISEIKLLVQDTVLAKLQNSVEKEFGKKFTKKLEMIVTRELGEFDKTSKATKTLKRDLKSGKSRSKITKQIKTSIYKELGKPITSFIIKKMESNREALKADIKQKVKRDFTDQYARGLSSHLQKIIKQNLLANIDETLFDEIQVYINEVLIDDIFDEIKENIGKEELRALTEDLDAKVKDRQILSKLADEIDEQLGTSMAYDLENAIGTAMESEVSKQIKTTIQNQIERELDDKIRRYLQEQIDRKLRSNLKGLVARVIKDKLEVWIDDMIEDIINMTTEKTLKKIFTQSTDRIVDVVIDINILKIINDLKL